MSNKNLLNESQIRQFMKLARLEPLTPGFVNGLTETTATEEELEETHGRGGNEYNDAAAPHRGGGVKLDENEADPEALEDYAAGDLERGHPEEAEADELEADAELGDDLEVEGDGPSEEELLAALEVIARAAGLEGLDMDVSGDVDDVEDVEVLDDPEVADVEVEDEIEMELQEGDDELEENWGSKAKEYRRRKVDGVEKKAGDIGGHFKDYEGKKKKKKKKGAKELEEDWGSKAKEYRRHKVDGVEKKAGDIGGHFKDYEEKKKKKKKKKNESAEATDDLVEQITKRVAARILKSALAKK